MNTKPEEPKIGWALVIALVAIAVSLIAFFAGR